MGAITDRARPYPTPDQEPVGFSSRLFDIPNHSAIHRAWIDQLSILTDPASWDDSGGGVSAIDTASAIAEALLWGGCSPVGSDGMETIIPNFTLLADGAYTEFQWVDSYDVLELSMMLKTDYNNQVDGFVLSINGGTSGYATSATRITQAATIGSAADNPSNGSFANIVGGSQALFFSPVVWRFWRGYGVWQGIGHGTLQRANEIFNHSQMTLLYNNDIDINTLRVSPLNGANLLVNCQFMLRGIPA